MELLDGRKWKRHLNQITRALPDEENDDNNKNEIVISKQIPHVQTFSKFMVNTVDDLQQINKEITILVHNTPINQDFPN